MWSAARWRRRRSSRKFIRNTISGVYVHATAVNNLLRGDALVEFGRINTGIASLALAALAVVAALAFGPTGAALAMLGIATTWTAGATIAFRYALAVPLVEPLLAALAALGAMIGYRLVVADRLMAEEMARRRAREAEMASAAAIQRAMLPSMQPHDSAEGPLDIFAQMIPAREVGGDLYDIVRPNADCVVITIGDVCGKGVPASLFMTITQTVMRLVVHSVENLQAEIAAANKMLVDNNREEMFTTLFCGVLDAALRHDDLLQLWSQPAAGPPPERKHIRIVAQLRSSARDGRWRPLRTAVDCAQSRRHAVALHRWRN